ncbi:rod shape-determining protein RodA [Oceanobacillus manasiensis]|uniref:rod shape-determining protein RodA n=1 Tax=Oceanobacillus manasiensis TaxID=586413 RepID=UPI0005A98A8D|nr:rod shape-determining protein RodA [Oceanobacillus manasiensis]
MKSTKHVIDYTLLFIIICFFLYSLIAVYSGSGQYESADSFYFLKRQVFWYILGFAVLAAFALFDYDLLKRWSFYLYLFSVLLLIYVHFFGVLKNGSQRWINLGFFELQPSEFLKFSLVLYIATILNNVGSNRLSFKKSIPVILKIGMVTLIPFVLILLQPDLGSAIMVAMTATTMVFVSVISSKMVLLILIGVVAAVCLIAVLYLIAPELLMQIFKPHQLSRIYGWLDPEQFPSNSGYQLKQARMGIGSGQLTGSGYNQGVQVQSGKVPEAHTDFIFAVIGEEFGFIGASILVFLYFFLIYRIVLATLNAKNLFGAYIGIGIIALIAFQVFQNIGMTIGLMPITGLALPYLSYGGSALLTNMAAIGLVFSVQVRTRKNNLFDKGLFSNNSN